MKKLLRLAATLGAAALLLAACGDDGDSGSSDSGSPSTDTSSSAVESSSAPPASDVKVGMAYDVGGRGDQSFNDAAAAGLEKAMAELGVTSKELAAAKTGETDATREERLRQLAEGGYNPIIAVGFAYGTSLGKVAPDYPDTNFAIIDSVVDAPNVADLVFAEEQGSFLVGAIAAQASKTGNVGFIGGQNVPLLQKFEAGFTQGAKAVNPDIEVQVKYLGEAGDFTGFNDPAKGQTVAQGMYDAGADIIYTAAGGSGAGAFKAATVGTTWGIGVDSDQYKQPTLDAVKDVILTSMLKRVDVAVFDMIASCADACLTGVQLFDLAKEGVGYSKSNPAVQPYEAKTDELAAQIVSGEITVSDKP